MSLKKVSAVWEVKPGSIVLECLSSSILAANFQNDFAHSLRAFLASRLAHVLRDAFLVLLCSLRIEELELLCKVKDRLLILFLFLCFPELLSCFICFLPQSLQGSVVIARFALCGMFVLVQHTIFGSKMVVNAFLPSILLFSSTLSASKTAGTTVSASWESSSLHSSAVLGVLNEKGGGGGEGAL